MRHTRTSENHAKAVGREIARARGEAELSQAELAKRLGVHPSYIAGVETGRANLTVGQLAHLSSALGAQLTIQVRVETTLRRRPFGRLPPRT